MTDKPKEKRVPIYRYGQKAKADKAKEEIKRFIKQQPARVKP